MKRRFIIVAGLIAIILGGGVAFSITPINSSVKEYLLAGMAGDVVDDYTDNAVVRTLSLLSGEVERLDAEIREFCEQPDQQVMDQAVSSWHRAYARWMTASSFLFGPAAHYDLHKQIATWPVDKVLVDHAMDQIENKEITMDEGFLRTKKPSTMRGFHVLEYLLFRNRQPRQATDLSEAELTYLSAASRALLLETVEFESAWIGTDNLAPDRAELLGQAGLPYRRGYAREFKNPGDPESRYASLSIVLQEMFMECIIVIEDMMPLIEEVIQATEPHNTDYWNSQDPYGDMAHMIQGVENAYLGGVPGNRGRSLAELVAEKSSVLDRKVRFGLAHAAYRIAAIKDTEGMLPEERELAVKVALGECSKLIDRLNSATLLVAMEPALRPWAAYGR